MRRSIRLHKKYGLNPTISKCFLCGKDKGEIALLGSAYKEEAPMNMVLDKEPCEVCRGYMKLGVIIIGVRDNEEENPYRTGEFMVLKEEAVARILKHRVCFMEQNILEKLGLKQLLKEKGEQNGR